MHFPYSDSKEQPREQGSLSSRPAQPKRRTADTHAFITEAHGARFALPQVQVFPVLLERGTDAGLVPTAHLTRVVRLYKNRSRHIPLADAFVQSD